jgi:ABC-type nitrate/sulfonate/bicarbonate transport system substrate-binding protein
MIRADGGQPEALVPVNNGFFHTDALVQGKADAATLAFYNFEVVEARNKGYDADFFALRDWGVPDFCQLVLVALPETLDHRAAEVASLVRVLRRGIDFLRQHPGEAHRIWNQETGTDPEDRLFQAIWHATTPHFVYDFMLADAYWERLSRWLVETGQIPAPVDGSEVWTNRFA